MPVWKKHFMNCLFPGKFISFSRNNFRYSRFFQVFGFSSLFSRFSRYLLHIPGFSRFFQDFPGAGHPKIFPSGGIISQQGQPLLFSICQDNYQILMQYQKLFLVEELLFPHIFLSFEWKYHPNHVLYCCLMIRWWIQFLQKKKHLQFYY